MKSGIAMRAASISVIYQHLLRLSPEGKIGLTSGEITNLVATDTQKIYEVGSATFHPSLVSQRGVFPTGRSGRALGVGASSGNRYCVHTTGNGSWLGYAYRYWSATVVSTHYSMRDDKHDFDSKKTCTVHRHTGQALYVDASRRT
jgi:hypothetical protein